MTRRVFVPVGVSVAWPDGTRVLDRAAMYVQGPLGVWHYEGDSLLLEMPDDAAEPAPAGRSGIVREQIGQGATRDRELVELERMWRNTEEEG